MGQQALAACRSRVQAKRIAQWLHRAPPSASRQAKLRSPEQTRLDLPALESWLREAARVIPGPAHALRLKDHILLVIFLKRLSDVFGRGITYVGTEFGLDSAALNLVQQGHKLVRFFIPPGRAWPPTRLWRRACAPTRVTAPA
jgi:hypothetical protein